MTLPESIRQAYPHGELMLAFVLINDIHLSDRTPSGRTDVWEDAVFAKLDQVAKVAVHVRAAAVLIAGDIWHDKTRKVGYGVIARFIEWARELHGRHGIHVLAIPGNHDEVMDRLDSVPHRPYGLLAAARAVIDVSEPSKAMEFHDGDDTRVAVLGVPYPVANAVEAFESLPHLPEGRVGILMAHCFATKQGGSYFGEPIHKYADLDLITPACWRVLHFGHDHSDHGIETVNGRVFVNHGALTRGSMAKEDVERIPKLTIVRVSGDRVEADSYTLRVRPAAEVFDLATKAKRDAEQAHVENFVARLRVDLFVAGPQPMAARVAGLDVPDVVRAKVQAFLDAAEVQP